MKPHTHIHPRTVGWFGTTSVAMGGINQSLFLLSALFIGQGAIPGQGSAAVVLLGVGLLLSWAATPGWTELILMYPNRVGGIAATCAEAFRPYSPILANLTGVCYWWGWVPTCGLTALLASSAINQWCLPWFPVPLMATCIVLFFAFINLCGVKWVMRLAMPIATASATLAFLSAVVPIYSGSVDWQQAFTFHLTVPFHGFFGQVTSIMAGLYLIGFAAPAFEQAACHVGETIDPNKNVPRAMFASAGLASLYFIVLPIVWLGALGPEPLGRELAVVLGPTFAPLLGGAAEAAAVGFMVFNMFHGTIAALAGSSRTLAQLSEDGLLPEFLAKRSRTDAPWAATLLTAGMAVAFLLIGDPVWLIAAANLTYLIGIALPSIAVWLLRKNEPGLARPYRAPRGTIILGILAAGAWTLTAILGFQQFGLPTVLIGIAFAYSGSVLYAWRKFADRRAAGLPGIARTLHLKLTGAMLIVLVLDAVGYLIAVGHVPRDHEALIVILEDTFVVVALLTFAVGLILPGMIANSAVEVSKAADKLVKGTLADFTRAMRALAAGNLDAAKAHFNLVPVVVHSRDEVGDMALSFNKLQEEIGRAAVGLEGAREGLSHARWEITETNERLRLTERKYAEEQLEHLRNQHVVVLNSVSEGVHWINLDGGINFENPAAAKMLGYEVSELIGKPAHLTMHHTRADGTPYLQCDCCIYATLRDGGSCRVEDEVFWRKDGTSFPVDYTSTPVRDENGQLIGAVVVFSDITERKHAEETAQRLQKVEEEHRLAVEAARVKNDFLATMSHELRTPLNSVIGFTGTMLMGLPGPITPAQKKQLETIKASARHQLSLINDLLDLAKIESGKVELKLEPIACEEVVRAVAESLRPFAENKGLAFHVDLPLEPRIAHAEKRALKQILINLVNNAIKFTEQGEVRVELRNGDKKTRIAVTDTGSGITEEDRPKLFKAFSRLEHTHAQREEGTGLGLHLSQKLAELMGGEIKLESEAGKGSTFTLVLDAESPLKDAS